MTELYIGLMSGTSLDGADGVLVDFAPPDTGSVLRVLAHRHRPFAPDLAAELLALNSPGDNELHRAALAGNALARVYAEVVEALLMESGAARDRVRAIGAHGQTVRHRPQEFDNTGYTLQLGNAALLAELCGIDVVADLRSRDVAAGGQGAPLVPAFHRAVFGVEGQTVGVLNIGGISNLTVLGADGSTLGFDCGPGNALMDHWCQTHTGRAFDNAGSWAASGRVIEPLLNAMMADPYFSLAAPKSTGRDRFNPAWLSAHLRAPPAPPPPVDVQATLAALTATCCANDVRHCAAGATELLVCGGGALNQHLMRQIAARLPGAVVRPSDERGLPAMQVEAAAFAWLARAFSAREPASLSSVTGASGARILGALYPAT
ncbi:MAG: anhydro-N-acetylmuramic acid kinase [Burkholderiales bacterium]